MYRKIGEKFSNGRTDGNFSDGGRTKAGGASPPQTPPRGGRTKAGGATPPQTPPRVKRAGGRPAGRTLGWPDAGTDVRTDDKKKTKKSKCVSNDRSHHDDENEYRIIKIGAILKG